MARGLSGVEQELVRLWELNGRLTPSDVLESAAPPGSVLHPLFAWDDSEAAHQYRLGQAAGLIRGVKIRVIAGQPDGTVEAYRVRQWVAASQAEIPGAAPGGYVPAAALDTASRTVLLQRMQREIQGLRRRYAGFAEFWQQLDAALAEHRGDAAAG